MSSPDTLSRPWSIALWVTRVLVAIPFFIAAWLEGMSSPQALVALDLVWIPDAPLWLVRLVAGIEGLAALVLILPGLPTATVTVAALVLLIVQIAALTLDLAADNLGDLPVKAVVLALTLFILWAQQAPPQRYSTVAMTLTHHQHAARSGQTRSVVVLLHGFGSNGAAMLGLAKALSIGLPDTTFLAPDAPNPAPGRPGGRMWFPIPELDGSGIVEANARLLTAARLFEAFLDDQLSAIGLPASAIALLGFSQGAGLAYEVGPRRRDQLAGVVAIAGRMKRKEALAAEVRSKPPFLILTGAADNLLSTSEIALTATALSKVGIPAMNIIMAGVGHGISDDGLAAARVFLKSALYSAN